MYRPPISRNSVVTSVQLLDAMDILCDGCESQTKCQNCFINDIRTSVMDDSTSNRSKEHFPMMDCCSMPVIEA